MAVHDVGSRNVSVAVANHIRTLDVAAMPSGSDDASAVMLADDGSSAMHAVLDVHAVSVDRAYLAVGPNAGMTSAFERNGAAGRRSAGSSASWSAGFAGSRALP